MTFNVDVIEYYYPIELNFVMLKMHTNQLPSAPTTTLGTNKAEGVVIRPIKNVVVKTAFGETERVIMKHKIPEFDETRNQKGNKKKKGTGIYSIIYSGSSGCIPTVSKFEDLIIRWPNLILTLTTP